MGNGNGGNKGGGNNGGGNKGGGTPRPPNGPSTNPGKKSGDGRGNNPPSK